MYTRTCARSFYIPCYYGGLFSFIFYHGFNGLDGFTGRGWKQDKNRKNPLVRMEGVALAVMLPPWSYMSEPLTPKPGAYHHLPYRRSPSSPRRYTEINRPILWRTALQAEVWW